MPSLSVRERLPQGGKLRQPMSAILGDHELSVRRFLSGGFHLWEPLDGESAIVLSGGGAKGSFEIGVLHLLAESGLLERMNVTNVTGCSVGAINALALSEGRGRESVAKTIGIWFGHLKRPSDMYVNEPWLDEVIDLVPEIGQAVRWFKTPSWKAHQVEGPEVTLGGIVTTAGNLAFGNMTPTHLQEYGTAVMIPAINFRINRQRLEDLVATANNLFTIMPAIEKLDNAVDWNAIKNSSIDLRLVCVDLVTGKTVYINKEPKAVMPSSTEDPGAPLDWSNPISADVTSIGGKTTWRERVLMATLASRRHREQDQERHFCFGRTR
jgi:hypothetical protein